VQRGASNVHFPDIRSAIDIPPWSDYDPASDEATKLRLDDLFAAVVSQLQAGEHRVTPVIKMMAQALADQHDMEASDVIAAALAETTGSSKALKPLEGDLVDQEWEAFSVATGAGHPLNTFVTRSTPFNPAGERVFAGLDQLVADVLIADKLREVRALAGFSRLEPGVKVVPPDLEGRMDWLPALEVYGEGIFLRVDEERLSEWEQRPAVRGRVGDLERRRQLSQLTAVLATPASPRFVLLHTLAHLLIRQLSFECGYSSASLRERLYARSSDERPMAGVLIYTASGDSEGTLGGLARQGEAPRLATTLLGALAAAAWCSTDPICIESTGQGMGALNRGACHACALVAETSCTQLNSLLDRALLVGTPDEPGLGFFADIVADAMTHNGGLTP
jgi:hypothetical protein